MASIPALTVTAGFILKIKASVRAEHGPAGSLVVSVIVTVPAVISAAEGVYAAVRTVALLNVPVPDVDQVDDVAPPPIIPFKEYVLPEHIVASEPALTVAT